MNKKINSFFEKIHILQNIYLKNKYFFKKKSYALDGEDIAIKKYFKTENAGFFVDVGCYHPIQYNNTMLLYKKGWNGINIDISEFSIKLFNFCRPRDLNLNLAISNKNAIIEFYYQKKISLLSTIKKDQSDLVHQGKVMKKKILSQKLTKVLDNTKYKNKKIDFLNIDTEGADLDVLESLDFARYSPRLVCVEIIPENLDINKMDIGKSKIFDFFKSKNYKRIWFGTWSHIFAK